MTAIIIAIIGLAIVLVLCGIMDALNDISDNLEAIIRKDQSK